MQFTLFSTQVYRNDMPDGMWAIEEPMNVVINFIRSTFIKFIFPRDEFENIAL